MTLEDARATTGEHRRAAAASPAPPWFALLFALAVVAHVIGNPPTMPLLRVADGLLAAAALTLVWRPASRPVWIVTASLVVVTAWLEAPVVGNHWLLMAAFATAVLAAMWRLQPWTWLAPTTRLIFVGFYAFAAFAKLNTAFLDPASSCAVFYANQALRSWGFAALPATGAVAGVPIGVVLVVELAVPVLLVIRRTRAIGVALAAAFHYAISLDAAQHFYDFTAVIFFGVAVYASADVTSALAQWAARRRVTVVVLTAAWAVLLALAVLPLGDAGLVGARLGGFVLWIPLGGAIVWLAVRGATRPAEVSLRPPSLAAVCLVAVVIVNGALPYTGVKTASGWNMYANLVTVGPRTNHLLVPADAQIVRPAYVRVVETNDEALLPYIGSGWSVPERNLRDHLATHPASTVVFVRSDGTRVSGTGRQLGRPAPEVVRRLLPMRSVDRTDPARCQALWLPLL